MFFNHFWSKWIISNQLFPNPSCIQDIYSFNNIILLFSEKNKPHGYFHHFSIGNSKIFIIEENCHNYVVWFQGFSYLASALYFVLWETWEPADQKWWSVPQTSGYEPWLSLSHWEHTTWNTQEQNLKINHPNFTFKFLF